MTYLRPTGLLMARTLFVTSIFALATSLASRTDATHAAAHTIAFQIWLASSLLADSLAVAAQALLAKQLAAGGWRRGGGALARAGFRLFTCFGFVGGGGLCAARACPSHPPPLAVNARRPHYGPRRRDAHAAAGAGAGRGAHRRSVCAARRAAAALHQRPGERQEQARGWLAASAPHPPPSRPPTPRPRRRSSCWRR